MDGCDKGNVDRVGNQNNLKNIEISMIDLSAVRWVKRKGVKFEKVCS